MEIPELLDTLKTYGVSVSVNGDRLKLVPGSRVPHELAEAVRVHKAEMLEFFREAEVPAEVDSPDPVLNAQQPHIPADANLLAWASELAEQDLTLPEPVSYVEAPLRTITTERVSHYASLYLREITYARTMRQSGGWGQFTPEWSRQQEEVAIGGLRALRGALEVWQRGKGDSCD